MCLVVAAVNNNYVMVLSGWAWASRTLELHCNTWVYVSLCLLAYVWPYMENLNWTNGYDGTHTFQICIHAICVQCKYLIPCWWIYWMRRKTPHRVTQHQSIECKRQTVWSERKGLLLDCSVDAKAKKGWETNMQQMMASSFLRFATCM